MREMGGLRRVMPWTYGAFLIGSLSLAGIPPFSGFWSKDEILGAAWTEGSILGMVVFGAGILGVFLTATYIFRALYMTFHGRYRGGEASSEGQSGDTSHGGLHESPLVMVVPMALLALLAVGSWVINFPGTHYLTTLLTPLGAHVEMFQRVPALISLMAGFLGIAVATALYWSGATRAVTINRLFGPVANLLSRKYYMDELYEDVIIRHVFYRRIARFLAWFDSDKGVVDRFANGIGFFGRNVGRGIARFQTGQLQTYATALSFGVVLIFAAYLVWGR
jgi:NADH-quinone oxidoreductase subunit L